MYHVLYQNGSIEITGPENKRINIMAAEKGNKYAEGNKGGRPTDYQPEYNEQVYKLCLLGATDKDLADFFNVDERTVNNWKEKHDEFFQSLKKGKQEADIVIADALFNKAKGFTVKTQKAFKLKNQENGKGSTESIEIVEVEETYPPDTTAIIFWLKNRQPDKWRDKRELDHTTQGMPFNVLNLGEGDPEPE